MCDTYSDIFQLETLGYSTSIYEYSKISRESYSCIFYYSLIVVTYTIRQADGAKYLLIKGMVSIFLRIFEYTNVEYKIVSLYISTS